MFKLTKKVATFLLMAMLILSFVMSHTLTSAAAGNTEETPIQTAAASGGWPFEPSKENMKNGLVPSGWVYIVSYDNGKFRVNTDNTVSPSKRYNAPFYMEHLGNNKYYIHAAYGGYLASADKAQGQAKSKQIVISDKPFKWILESASENGIKKFAIISDKDRKSAIQTWGYCTEDQDSQVTLSNLAANRIASNNKFIIDDWGIGQNEIPEWWKDYQAGKPAPKAKVVEPVNTGQNYYGDLTFKEETKRPITTTSVNYNLEYPKFDDTSLNWGTLVKSTLLSRNERGTYLRASADSDYVVITKYSQTGEDLGSKEIKHELPIFGAIFSGQEYNYIAYGQKDADEKKNKESIRIVKYDKEFNRISSVSLKGKDTNAKIPFNYTARFAENGNQLILHMARTMYKSKDGLNHQSNLTITVNTDKMTASTTAGTYVSHSFDTYVQFAGDTPVYVDLGDANPRSVVLQKGSGSSFTKATMFNILGPLGANYTGVSIGGFELSKNNYITAIATIDQAKAKWGKGKSNGSLNSSMVPSNLTAVDKRNIVVSILPRQFKNGDKAKTITIAKYIGTKKVASTPQLLKINDNKFAVLWAEYNATGGNYSEEEDEYDVAQSYVVFYMDENGQKLGELQRYKKVEDFYNAYITEVTKNIAPSSQVLILATPSKVTYKVGEPFDMKGINVVNVVNGKQTNINKDITFYTSKVVELTQGRKFTTAGTKVVEIRYKDKRVGTYTIEVTK